MLFADGGWDSKERSRDTADTSPEAHGEEFLGKVLGGI
jgi:hypothetical protein